MKIQKLKSYTISIALAAIVAFGVGHNEIVDTLILVGVWILIGLGSLAAILMGFGIGVLAVAENTNDENVIQKWKDLDSPNWFVTIPLTSIWLTALVHVGWHVTAVVYFIQMLITWSVTYLLFQAIEEFMKKGKKDPLAFIKNPEVKDAILKSRKPIIGLDEGLEK